MEPHFKSGPVTLYHGDCIEVMRTLPDASVHAVVTDPPYGLEFMGKEWDGADGFRRSLNEADAGRDSVFGRTSRKAPEYKTASKAAAGMMKGGISAANGRPSFMGGLNPKCLNCDKWQRGSNPCNCDAPEFTNERLPRLHAFQDWCEVWSDECLRVLRPGGFMLAFGGSRTWHRLASAIEDAGFEVRDSIAWLYGSGFPKHPNVLKPAFEPIVVARKPMIGTIAANVEAHGTGALNVDAVRTERADGDRTEYGRDRVLPHANTTVSLGKFAEVTPYTPHESGRWPTNVVIEGSQADELDRQSGVSQSRIGKPRGAAAGDGWGMTKTGTEYSDEGGASRFFPTFHYEAKAGSSERPEADGVLHPTVKPLALMQWLVRLVTPPNGTVLEPFAGSGTTAEACMREGFNCIAIEREETYLPLILQRLSKPHEQTLDLGEIA